MGFTKLDSKILLSSIMAESPETFKVWVCLLAITDSDGIAMISSIGVASSCFLPIDVVKKSLDILLNPDCESRSLNDEGRRIRRVDGGFEVINYLKYREYTRSDSSNAIRQKRYRDKKECNERNALQSNVTPLLLSSSFELNSNAINGESTFDLFWKQYPRKEGKGAAEKAWDKISAPVETAKLIETALIWQKRSEQWTKDGGQFIPMPATYLNQKRWMDEPTKPKAKEWVMG